MKRITQLLTLHLLLSACCLPPTLSMAQVKVIKATQQKTYGGRGGVFMNYSIDLIPRKGVKLELDSVKTVAGSTLIQSGWMPNDSGHYRMNFGFALQAAPKCPTCEEISPNPPNMTKGIKVYYRRNGKKAVLKVKRFRELEEFRAP